MWLGDRTAVNVCVFDVNEKHQMDLLVRIVSRVEAPRQYFVGGFSCVANHSFGYTLFDNHDGSFIVPLPAALVEGASGVRFARLITLCGSGPELSLLALQRSSQIDWGHYTGDELPFLVYDFETGRFPTLLQLARQNVQRWVGRLY